MEPRHEERRLTTILSADVVGYSRLMAADESGTLAQPKTHRKELFEPKTAQYRGRIVKLKGDGLMVYFGYPRAHEDDAERDGDGGGDDGGDGDNGGGLNGDPPPPCCRGAL